MSLKYETIRTWKRLRHFRHHRLHRTDGPANIGDDGDLSWHQYGERHREDGPSHIWISRLIIRYFIKDIEYGKKHYESKIRS